MKTIKLLSKQTLSQKKAKADLSYLESLAPKSKDGVYVPFWLWASKGRTPNSVHAPMPESTPEPTPTPEPTSAPQIDVPTSDDQAVLDMLVANPSISGSTLLNLLKSQGYVISKKPDVIPMEADASSAQPTAVLATQDKKEEPKKVEKKTKKNKMNLREAISCSFTESMKDNGIGPQKFKVVLLEEGLGNLRDAYYYTKEALKTAMPVFEGKKIYADHPSVTEEETRPERSVKDVLGHFENIQVEESEDGRGQLTGDVRILPDKPYEWARGLMRHAVDYSKKYPDKEFIGLSINASGDAEETILSKFMLESKLPESVKLKLNKALDEGIETIKLVHVISDATSCDLVTEAGAGGKVLEMLEGDKKMENLFESEEKKIEGEEKKLEGEDKKAGDEEKKETFGKPEGEEKKDEEPKKDNEEALPQDDKKDGGEDHEDEDQDMKLIKSMMDKYLGKPEHDKEEMTMAKEAYKTAREAGEEEADAMKTAGHAMKMARYMAAKSSHPAGPAEAVAAPKKDEEKKEDMESKEAKKDEECKESDKLSILAAENAKLKEALKKFELEKHIESKLSESKLPRSATRLFKETVGEFRSKDDFDKKLEKFTTTYREIPGGEADELFSFVTMQEKASEAPKSDSFADCLE